MGCLLDGQIQRIIKHSKGLARLNETMRARKLKKKSPRSLLPLFASPISMPAIFHWLITPSWQCLMGSLEPKPNQYPSGCICSDISSYGQWIRFSQKINNPLRTGISTGSCTYGADIRSSDWRKGRFLETARQTDLNGQKSLASGNKQTPDSPIYLDTGGYVVGGNTQAFIIVWIYPQAASLRTQGGHSALRKGTERST